MGNIINKYICASALVACGAMLGGCIEETFPTNKATSEMISSDAQALDLIVKTLSNFTNNYNTYGTSSSASGDSGWVGWNLARDKMCEDLPIYSTTYDYFNSVARGMGVNWSSYPYYYFYVYIDKCNDVLKGVDYDSLEDGNTAHMIGNILGFRSACYLELYRMYEYMETGYQELDSKAEGDKIYGLTVPIVDEREWTVDALVNNPRAPFWTMYRFVLNDLNTAERLLSTYSRPKVSYMDVNVIYGFKARLYLEMATRFERDAADLQKQIAAEGSDDGYPDLGITSVAQCWALAQEYAEKAINSGHQPLTEKEWRDPDNGFITPVSSWIWGTCINNELESQSRWYAYVTDMNNEATWAFGQGYNGFHMISKTLYEKIDDADWRKMTWISPEDAGSTSGLAAKYWSNQTDALLAKIPAYGGLKIRTPDLTDYKKGLVVSSPLMRVEEMYFNKIECLAHTSGLGAAKSALETFMNSYRYADGSYTCDASDLNEFMNELMIQRRIEFWGEGIVYYDYKRLRLGVFRNYDGTNFPAVQRLNTQNGFVSPWMNLYFSDYSMSMKNEDFKGNPNFSGVVPAGQ